MTLTVANPAVVRTALSRQTHGAASKAGSANVSHIWLYRTADTRANVEAAGYFNNARGSLTIGTLIKAVMAVDTAPVTEEYVVTAVAAAADVTIVRASAGAVNIPDNTTGNAAAAALAAGVGRQNITFYSNLVDITAADILTSWVPGYKFKILALDFFVDKPATTAAKLATVSPKITGVAVTGGAVALTSANCTPAGVKVAGSAVTALNTGSATDSISLTGSAVTAFVEGNGWFVLSLQNMDVADAIASLNAA